MANLKTSADLIADALFRSSEPTDGTSDYAANGIVWLNRAYRAIYMGGSEIDPEINENWWWMKSESNLIITPVITTGTVSVTKNSASITFSTTPKDIDSTEIDVDGYFLRIDGHPDVFKISDHTATQTGATLDSVYTGTTAATASYKLFKLDYTLATDLIKLMEPMQEYREKQPVTGMTTDAMERSWPLGDIQFGIPTRFAMLSETTVRFNKGGGLNNELYRIDYDYYARPTELANDSSSPLVPTEYRYVLADTLRALILEDKGDARTGDAWVQAKQGVRAMMLENQNRVSKFGNPGAIHTRQHEVGRARGPLRTESGVIIG